jgi:hypothetical protein
MSKQLEKKWWFMAPLVVVSGYSAFLLVQSAGIAELNTLSQGLVFVMCFDTLRRGMSFFAWLGVVAAFPAYAKKLLEE